MAKRTCCLCCGRRGGVEAIGVLFVVFNVLLLLGCIGGWITYFVTVPRTSDELAVHIPGGYGADLTRTSSLLGGDENYGLRVDTPLGSVNSQDVANVFSRRQRVSSTPRSPDPRRYFYSTTIPGCLAGGTAFVGLCLLFSSLLVHGVRSSGAGMILSWVIFYGILFGLLALGVVGSLISVLIISREMHGIIVGIHLPGVLSVMLLWYWWAVVLGHYSELRRMGAGYHYREHPSTQEICMQE